MSTSRSERGHDWRLLPAALAAWPAAWAATGLGWAWLLGWGVVCMVGGMLGWRLRWWWLTTAAIVAAACLATGWVRATASTPEPVTAWAQQGVLADVSGRVSRDPRTVEAGPGPAMVVVDVVTHQVAARGERWTVTATLTVMASHPEWARLVPGDRVVFMGTLRPGTRPDGTAAVVRARGQPHLLGRADGLLGVVAHLRTSLREACQQLPGHQDALIPALVVGDVSGMTDDLDEQFRATGLTHLCAVSGSNLTILLVFLGLALRWLGVRGWWLRAASVGAAVFFVVLCRAEPSVVRATAMGLVGVAAIGPTGSLRKSVRHLLAAVVMLMLIDPWMSRSWGFALSVAATVGIAVCAAPWSRRMSRWCPAWLAEAMCVPWAAQLFTQPMVTALSGEVSMVGVLTNAAAGPFVAPATVLGMVVTLLAVVWPQSAAVVAWLAGACAQVIVWIAAVGAELPGASLVVGQHPGLLALLTLACVAAVAVSGRVLAHPAVTVLVSAALVGACLHGPVTPGWPPPRWAAVFCDVGQGDAAVFDVGHHAAVVVDTGPDPGAVKRCLDRLGVQQVPLLIVTHAHKDHYGGTAGVCTGRQVAETLASPFTLDPVTINGVASAAGTRVVHARPGQQWRVGRVSLEVLGPRRAIVGEGDDSSRENDSSVVLRATVDGVRFLMTGDVEPAGQRDLLAAGVDLRVEVLKVPHHGSSRQDDDFLTATGARAAVVSVGKHNDYGHPAVSTLTRLGQRGMRIYRTDECGDIGVGRGDGGPEMTCRQPRT